MSLLTSALEAKLGDYASGKADAHLADPDILQTVRLRRRQLSRMTTAFDLPLAKARLPEADYHISRKIDGEYTCLVYRDGEVITINPGGTLRSGAPFHQEAADILKSHGVKSALLGGELHVRRTDGEKSRIHDVIAAARAPKNQEAVDSLCFAIFNIYDLDGQDLSMHYGQAMEKAAELFADGDRVFAVETHTGSKQDALKHFDTWVTDGLDEGIVLRSDSAGVFKIKPRHSLDLAIIGFSEGIDDRAGLLHSLLVGIVRDNKHAQIIGRVGGGFSDEERKDLLETLKPMVVDSDYAEVNSDRVAYQMVNPSLIVEISCLELIARTLHGSPIERMVIKWDASKSLWQGVRRLPLCSIRSPQFERLREDKKFTEADAGLQRIMDIVDIPSGKRGALDALELPKSEILNRSVATKTLKGATMVRKLLMWKTNKEEASREFPAYVLHLTDYSPNRKEPLAHEICVSDSREQIDTLFAEWKDKYYVRGWKEQ